MQLDASPPPCDTATRKPKSLPNITERQKCCWTWMGDRRTHVSGPLPPPHYSAFTPRRATRLICPGAQCVGLAQNKLIWQTPNSSAHCQHFGYPTHICAQVLSTNVTQFHFFLPETSDQALTHSPPGDNSVNMGLGCAYAASRADGGGGDQKRAKFGMAKSGREKIWHQLENTTAKFGTKLPACGTRTSVDREWWLLFPIGLALVVISYSF